MITQAMLSDALRYIGMPQKEADEEIKEKIIETFKLLEKIDTPRFTYKKLKLNIGELSGKQGVFFENTSLIIFSKDLIKLFEKTSSCYIMAATLGSEVDRQINIKQRLSMLDAMVLDACASVLIDKICDDIEEQIMEEISEEDYLTMRFSPGYGDVPLEVSKELLEILQAEKRIGLTLTKTNMLLPTKSITALVGISKEKTNRQKSCAHCNLIKVCAYRKRGDRCGL